MPTTTSIFRGLSKTEKYNKYKRSKGKTKNAIHRQLDCLH